MNFVFISPQFPAFFWNFCDRLKKRGVTVLGIGDTPYEQLSAEVKQSLNEYYWVSTMNDYDKVYRAVAFLTFKHGRIDWLESNNEYWLEQDARLRTDFNITTGFRTGDIERCKSKARMKEIYAQAGIPSARQSMVTTPEAAREFIGQVGWPVLVKPEGGVGAIATWKLENDEDLTRFFDGKPDVPYVMEEFIDGDIVSYDAIVNSAGDPLFESMTEWPPSVADIVNQELDLTYYVAAGMPDALRRLGRAAVKAFGAVRRFVHLEFFRLKTAKPGLGDVGDFIGLEVNMRPAGGYTPDMMDYAHGTDVFALWADMVTEDRRVLPESGNDHCCVSAGRRDKYEYVHTEQEIFDRYGKDIVISERVPELNVPQMGNMMYIAHAADDAAAREFIRFVTEKKE